MATLGIRRGLLGRSPSACSEVNGCIAQGFTPPPNDNPADFFLDVIAGHVARQGDAKFEASDLFTMWHAAAGQSSKSAQREPPRSDAPAEQRVSPAAKVQPVWSWPI